MGIVLEDDKIEEALIGLRKFKEFLKAESKKSILLDDEEEKVFLQLALKRIPKLNHIVAMRLKLKHPIVSDPKSICLIVRNRDDKKMQRDYEEDVAYWKQLLSNKGITVGEIITFKQLKTEYKTFEARRNLCNGFDMFLVDAVLTPLMPNALGKHFVKKRKMPYAINMNETRLEKQFERAIRRATMNITGHGCICSSQVGYLGLTNEKIIDNVKEVVTDIDKKLPGGWKNVDSLLLKTTKSVALPVYMAIHSVDEVILPKLNLKEEPVEDEVNTLSRSKVKVYPSGKVELVREEPDDLLELEHTQLPFENHLLALQEVLKNKKGKKKLGTNRIVREVKEKEGKRKRFLQKLIQDKELRQLANFKEAEVLKAETIKNKEVQRPKNVNWKKPLNPFTKEGEKLIKKNIRKMRVQDLENMDSSIVTPKVKGNNKKNKLKKKVEMMLNSTPDPKNESNDKKKWKKLKKVTNSSLIDEKKEKFDNKLGLSQKLNKIKQKLRNKGGDDSTSSLNLSSGAKLSKNGRKKLKKKAALLNSTSQDVTLKTESTPTTKIDEISEEVWINSSPKSKKKWSKKVKKETKREEGAVKSLTSNLPRIGSLKKRSYKVNSKGFKTGSQGKETDEPKLLSIKSDFKESPKKSPMEKGSAKKNKRNVFAKMQKN